MMPQALRLLNLNDVRVVGRLTRDPELRYTTQGTPVCHFRMAVGRSYKDRNSNEWREEVAFVPCTVWREAAERCGQKLKKGSPLYVEGRLKTREWQTKEGQKRVDLEVDVMKVQFLESMGTGESAPGGSASYSDDVSQEPAGVSAGSYSEGSSSPAPSYNDDEVPF